ncbi:MAG TPA: MMPL family transporter [Gaiellaceae bacterium]|nr:MMPL family transporter [Gaiellaceae bacterium]
MAEAALARIASAVSRRRRAVIAIWLALLAGGAWFSLHQSDHLSGGGWEVPGSASLRVAGMLDTFPGVTPPTFTLLVTGSTPSAVRLRLGEIAPTLRGDPRLRPGEPRLADGGRAAFVPVGYTGATSNSIDEATRLRTALVQTSPSVQTRVLGEPAIWSNFQTVSKQQLARGEEIGFPLILLILLAAFGTVAAAVAPLALGFVAVFLTGAVIYGLSRSFEVSVYVTNMASMIGIGVAVDYSLFIVSRFRSELREGASSERALRRALASSGTAVVFSGATVAVALAGLFAIDVNGIRSMAVGAIVVVCIAVLASTTLLPALLAVVGGGVDRFRLRLPWRTGEEGTARFWTAWARTVMRHPVVALVAGVAVMLALSSPLLGMTTFNRGLDELPRSSEVRAATERAMQIVGPGYGSPVHVIVPGPAEALAQRLATIPGVVSVTPPVPSKDGRHSLVDARLAVQPESSPARQIVRRIEAIAGPDALVGGSTVFDLDVEHAIFGGLWKMLAFILAASYVVLALLLRSVVLPLKAVLMNLLSVGAAYGVLVAIFQWGWLDWLGYSSPGYVTTIVPALVLAVTFGLSMDYEVFLLTRIRERWLEHGDNERAVAEGLVRSARIITSAAAVMVAVFGAFSVAGAPALKELGVGLGAAIFLDATLVRLVIVPAAMRLLGSWNWYWPGRAA